MFFYSFNNHAWHDRVFRAPEKLPKKYKAGDILRVDKQYVLLLGEEVSFEEQYLYQRNGQREVVEHYPWVIKIKTLAQIHRMVEQRFSPYKKIIPLFLPKELDYLLNKKTTTKKVPHFHEYLYNANQNIIAKSAKKIPWQQLIVFPDLRTLRNMIVESDIDNTTILLTSQSTQLQTAKSFWWVSNGTINTVITTHSSLYQNRKQLESIIFVYPQKRYYASHQEPRYKTKTVLNKIHEIYWCQKIIVD